MPDLDYSNPVTISLNSPITETLYLVGIAQIGNSTGTGYINGSPIWYGGANEKFYVNGLKVTSGDVISGGILVTNLKGYRVKA